MTGILSNNIVRAALALLAVVAVVYGISTTGGNTETTVAATADEDGTTNVSETSVEPTETTTTETTTTEDSTTEGTTTETTEE